MKFWNEGWRTFHIKAQLLQLPHIASSVKKYAHNSNSLSPTQYSNKAKHSLSLSHSRGSIKYHFSSSPYLFSISFSLIIFHIYLHLFIFQTSNVVVVVLHYFLHFQKLQKNILFTILNALYVPSKRHDSRILK